MPFNAALDQGTTSAINDANFYVPVVTLSTQDNTNLLSQLKLGFKRINIRDKQQSKVLTQTGNQYLDYLIDPSFHGVNRLFVLSFENNVHQISHKR